MGSLGNQVGPGRIERLLVARPDYVVPRPAVVVFSVPRIPGHGPSRQGLQIGTGRSYFSAPCRSAFCTDFIVKSRVENLLAPITNSFHAFFRHAWIITPMYLL